MFISRKLLISLWLGVLVIAVMVYLCTVETERQNHINNDSYAATSVSAKNDSKLPAGIELP